MHPRVCPRTACASNIFLYYIEIMLISLFMLGSMIFLRTLNWASYMELLAMRADIINHASMRLRTASAADIASGA